jgi:hypothetical protein
MARIYDYQVILSGLTGRGKSCTGMARREEAPGSYEAPAREARPLRSQFYCAVILRSCTERRMAPKRSPDTELTRIHRMTH